MDEWELRRARGERWLTPVATLAGAAAFVDDLGLALLFPADRIEAPSLWEAVAGEDAEPFAAGMGESEERIWAWKDELPQAGLSWYGKFLFRRGSLLSPRLLAALYPGRGRDTDHRSIDLSREAHEIVEALRGGPMTTAALRQLVGDKSRYERAVGELHRHLLVTSAGVEVRPAGWPAAIVELTCRLFPVGGEADPAYAIGRFLETMLVTTGRTAARALGWPLPVTRQRLDSLVQAGRAERIAADTYVHNGLDRSPVGKP
jgi:hypothetical protein